MDTPGRGDKRINRRELLLAGGRTPSIDVASYETPVDAVPIPPPDAVVLPTACEYCIVGCGYKAYVWPYNRRGGSKAGENAFKTDFPVSPASGKWVSPNMHGVVRRNGQLHHVVIVPDGESAVNRKGNHSVRGGTLGLKPYNPTRPTADRLQMPLVRSRGMLQAVSWDNVTDILATVSRHVIARHGAAAWGIKYYSYQFWENTYAVTKFAYGAIGTPAGAEHDKPTAQNDAVGLDDSGVDGFSAAYQDWRDADVVYISGVDPYENQTVLFTEWMAPGGAKIIFVNPRKSPTAAYAERTGGIHLQVWPGTDSVLNNAIARYIVEQGWEDWDFIARKLANRDEIQQEKGQWRRLRFGMTYAEYREFLLADEAYTLPRAAEITRVPAAKIMRAAEMLAKPRGRLRPKASFMLEKGNYWSFNFPNSASLTALGLLCGAGSRPGQVISRAGGHQRGMMAGASYPLGKSPAVFKDPASGQETADKMPLNFDQWAMSGKLRLAWMVGHTWVGSMAAGQSLRQKVHELVRAHPTQVDSLERDAIIARLVQRVDEGGMVLVQQDIYANDLTEYADIVLPAATWGETDLTRAQGERRLRIYSKFYDPPGEARPDWWIIGQVATRMGYQGFDWPDGNAVFEEAAARSKGGPYDYVALVEAAKARNVRAHELLRSLSTTGHQLPARVVDGKLVGTIRLHDETLPDGEPAANIVRRFKTASGKAMFMRGDWRFAEATFKRFSPRDGELWVLNGRVNHIWQTMYDDLRKPFVRQRYPANFLFINPADASARGIESGDLVRVENDDVVDQLGQRTKGVLSLVAYVTDEMAPGVTYTYAFYPGQGSNAVVPAVTDPITGVYNYKIGKGRIARVGETPLKKVTGAMSFVPRTIA